MVDVAGSKFDAWKKRNAWWTCLIVVPILLIAIVTWLVLALSQLAWERIRYRPPSQRVGHIRDPNVASTKR